MLERKTRLPPQQQQRQQQRSSPAVKATDTRTKAKKQPPQHGRGSSKVKHKAHEDVVQWAKDVTDAAPESDGGRSKMSSQTTDAASNLEWDEYISIDSHNVVAEAEDSTAHAYATARAPPTSQRQVQLSELITHKRRNRKSKPAEDDFEVIPPLRSVIALDDAAVPELTIDEPWEHIYGKRPNVEPTYATVAAGLP